MDEPTIPRRRHVWVDSSSGTRHPGLILAWRTSPEGGWEAHVAVVREGSVLASWQPAASVRLVADDRWDDQYRNSSR
ncbi:MAG: hypothetical protein L0H41_07970 [Microlunatus sp.]|nr:hypothetical protein [Microlunatus sp.]MDN5770856.1 hypothetical protein [Microlunatus sp.]